MQKLLPVICAVFVLSLPQAAAQTSESIPFYTITLPALINAHMDGLEALKPALLESFKYIEGYDIWDILDETREDQLSPAHIHPLMASLKAINTIAQSNAKNIEPFTASTNESIKKAADVIHNAYQSVIKGNDASVAVLQAYLDKGTNVTQEELGKIGYEAESVIGDLSWSLYYAGEWLVDAVQKTYPDKLKGYPQEDREAILKRIEEFYGVDPSSPDSKKISHYEGMHFVNGVVSLYETLTQQKK